MNGTDRERRACAQIAMNHATALEIAVANGLAPKDPKKRFALEQVRNALVDLYHEILNRGAEKKQKAKGK